MVMLTLILYEAPLTLFLPFFCAYVNFNILNILGCRTISQCYELSSCSNSFIFHDVLNYP